MSTALSPEAIAQLFTEARSFSAWTAQPIDVQQLHELYELMKMGRPAPI